MRTFASPKTFLGFYIAFFASSFTHSARGDALPTPPISEDRLFTLDDGDGGFRELLARRDILPEQLYVRWDTEDQRWCWCVGGDVDRRALLSGTRVQAKRFGRKGTDELNWYELQSPDAVRWKLVTDRQLPQILVRGKNNQTVVFYEYPKDWWKLGGKVDPIPEPKPQCTVKMVPPKIPMNTVGTAVLDFVGPARVTSATINDKPVDLLRRQIDIVGRDIGTFTATAHVKGPTGEGTCEAKYEVTAVAAPSIGCTLTADPPKAAIGETVVLALASTGQVTRGELDGVVVFGGSTRRRKKIVLTGKHVVKATVYDANDGSAECSVELEGLPGQARDIDDGSVSPPANPTGQS